MSAAPTYNEGENMTENIIGGTSKKVRTTIYIDRLLHKKIRIYCVKNNTDLTKLVDKFLKECTKGIRL